MSERIFSFLAKRTTDAKLLNHVYKDSINWDGGGIHFSKNREVLLIESEKCAVKYV